MKWVKKKFWIVTALLKDEDEEGEPLNWSSYTEEYMCNTYEEAVKCKERLLAGEDEYYGDYIESAEISDEPEEREVWVEERVKSLEEKKIDRLYKLLENQKLDNETSASLKWAIFELENMYCKEE